jgi:hypothetical protein
VAEAAALNRLVIDALGAVGLLFFPFSLRQCPGIGWPGGGLGMARCALPLVSLLPVVYGDVIFDTLRGDPLHRRLFAHLAATYNLAASCWRAPNQACGPIIHLPHLLERITPPVCRHCRGVGSSAATDVTGGMAARCSRADWVELIPGLEYRSFRG